MEAGDKGDSWREKSMALFRSGGSSRRPRQSETGLNSQTLRRSVLAADLPTYTNLTLKGMLLDSCAMSVRLLLRYQHRLSYRQKSRLKTKFKGQRPQVSDIAERGENVQANDDVPTESNVVSNQVATGAADPQDLWSVAYREAVLSFPDEMKSGILANGKVSELFTSLGETNKELIVNSLFRRGLQRLQGPLGNIKLGLDIVRPVASIDPTASTALGVVSSVTAVSS